MIEVSLEDLNIMNSIFETDSKEMDDMVSRSENPIVNSNELSNLKHKTFSIALAQGSWMSLIQNIVMMDNLWLRI